MFIKVHDGDVWFNSNDLQEIKITHDRIKNTYKVLAFVRYKNDAYTIYESTDYKDCKDFVATLMLGLSDVVAYAK